MATPAASAAAVPTAVASSAVLSPSPVLQLSYESAASSPAASASPATSASPSDSSTDAAELAHAQSVLAQQPASGVRDFFVNRYEVESTRNWDRFYRRNADRFYKDRHYLTAEFPELAATLPPAAAAEAAEAAAASPASPSAQAEAEEEDDDASYPAAGLAASASPPPPPLLPIHEPPSRPAPGQRCFLEVGCGVGNALFPLLRRHPSLFFYGVDCSRNAIQVVQNHPEYARSGRCAAWVVDLVTEQMPECIRNDAIDFATLIFVLSAIHPNKMEDVLRKVHAAMKKDEGVLFIRDYALYDLAQLRFGANSKLGSNWYVRTQDGTRSYFFDLDELSNMLRRVGFEVLEALCVKKTVVNRKEKSEMARRFVQIRAKARSQPQLVDAQPSDAAAAAATTNTSA